MFQKFLLFFTVSFLCASAVSASMITVGENELAENNKWLSDTPFKEGKEDKKENEETFSTITRDYYNREDEWKEEHHFDFDRDDRWHHRLKDCEQPSPIPIPGSLMLFLSGIAGLVGLVKHRTK